MKYTTNIKYPSKKRIHLVYQISVLFIHILPHFSVAEIPYAAAIMDQRRMREKNHPSNGVASTNKARDSIQG